jgi:hypothetical protein
MEKVCTIKEKKCLLKKQAARIYLATWEISDLLFGPLPAVFPGGQN